MFSRQLPFFYLLSSNEIFSIHQDREGYFWIGTTNGLARYDGYQLNTFRTDYKNQNLLTDNGITAINDNDLYVWIGTWKGLNLYNKQTCRITPFSDVRLLDKVVDAITVDKDGNVWVSAGGMIYRCDSTAHIIKEYEAGNIPSWADRVFPESLLVQELDDNGSLQDGFINSVFGQKGVTVTSEGYNYLEKDGDIWLYSGITSVNSDESNL